VAPTAGGIVSADSPKRLHLDGYLLADSTP
jgi:hypothetical protein